LIYYGARTFCQLDVSSTKLSIKTGKENRMETNLADDWVRVVDETAG
jgi:hypothetical protein